MTEKKTIGLIGLGAMGAMYARRFCEAGYPVVAADIPENFEDLKKKFAGTEGVKIVKDGHLVSRMSDYIIYSVEASNIDKVVAMYGPSTKVGACVGGQTSCKAPEIAAFEKYLPEDVEIVSVHSMHGPGIDSRGQPLVVIRHRAKDSTMEWIETALSCFNSTLVHLTAKEHDIITADVQAVTHMAFLSMGTAWRANNQYPWTISRLSGGLENAKINISMRIYANSWHVYAGLAMTNPMAHIQSLQYADSVTDLFKLMVLEQREELRNRLYKAREYVFDKVMKNPEHSLLLPDELLGQFSLSNDVKSEERKPNSQLSILGIVDCWYQLKIIPYDHVICSTPLFRILLGVTEYLFMTPGLLDQCLEDIFNSNSYRGDDLEFVISSRSWATMVSNEDFAGYKRVFESTQEYFKHKLPEATKIGNDMIKAINDHRPPPAMMDEHQNSTK